LSIKPVTKHNDAIRFCKSSFMQRFLSKLVCKWCLQVTHNKVFFNLFGQTKGLAPET